MAQFYTLEEAADKLGVSVSELKRRLQTDWKTLRPFRDGTSMRFRSSEIDELARSLGRSSEPELQLGDADAGGSDSELDMPLLLDEPTPPPPQPKSGKLGKNLKAAPKPAEDEPLVLGGDDEVFSLADDRPSKKGDSDVRLEKAAPKQATPPPGTDEVDLDEELLSLEPDEPKSSPSRVSSRAPKSGPAPANDGNSDFELTLGEDSDDSLDLGAMPVTRGGGAESGINLQSPADSGISLERAEGSSDEIDFELNLEDAASASRISKAGKKEVDSDSEFELTLDDDGGLGAGDPTGAFVADDNEAGQRDIFETDFNIPALDEESSSEAMALEGDTDLESSDFDIDLDAEAAGEESVSEVVAIDDEAAEEEEEPRPKKKPAAKSKAKAVEVEVEDEEEVDFDNVDDSVSASKALRGISTDEDEELEEVDEAEATGPARVELREAPQASWGVVPVLFLVPSVLVMGVIGLMSYELLRGMWGYQQPGKSTAVVTSFITRPFLDEADHKQLFGD
jgi:hypothetical protein